MMGSSVSSALINKNWEDRHHRASQPCSQMWAAMEYLSMTFPLGHLSPSGATLEGEQREEGE